MDALSIISRKSLSLRIGTGTSGALFRMGGFLLLMFALSNGSGTVDHIVLLGRCVRHSGVLQAPQLRKPIPRLEST